MTIHAAACKQWVLCIMSSYIMCFMCMHCERIAMACCYTGPAPAIPELGINPYQWGTECISGDVDAGPATSFPESIGLVS